MTKTINLTNILIQSVNIDYVGQTVIVAFCFLGDDGNTYGQKTATFWVTMPNLGIDPQTGKPNPIPAEWFTIPAGYITTLVNMRNDISTALQNKFLV